MSDDPSQRRDGAKPPLARKQSAVRRRKSGQLPRLTLGTVLVVDDDAGMLATLERMVARGGYDVVCVSDPRLALELCLSERPTLVLSDMDMPALSGKELAQAIHAALGASAPPVVVLTGGDLGRVSCPEVAAVAHKPVAMEQLLALLGAAAKV